jgi:hypothetical protein
MVINNFQDYETLYTVFKTKVAILSSFGYNNSFNISTKCSISILNNGFKICLLVSHTDLCLTQQVQKKK